MRLGNLLSLGLWAAQGRAEGVPTYIRWHPQTRHLLDSFPRLREELFLAPDEVKVTDRRLTPWRDSEQGGFQASPVLDSYVRQYLLPDSRFAVPLDLDPDAVVLNVRRGDYFTIPEARAEFGLDTAELCQRSLQVCVQSGGPATEIIVVSDDVEWCRENLKDMCAALAPVRFIEGDMWEDLQHLAHAPRLILPNSTFSYWGGYIGDVLHPGRQVVAPWFFRREPSTGEPQGSWDLRPHWVVVGGPEDAWEAPAA